MDIYYIIVLLQIILFSLCLLFAIGYLSLRKLSLPCIGCSKGSWWYSCTPNTGYGTKTCSEYKKIHGTISQVINNIYGVIKQFTNLFTNIDFEKLYLKFINDDLDMAISSKNYKVDLPYAVFETKEFSITNLSEKPTFSYPTNAGIYMFKKELIKLIPINKFYDITDLILSIINEGRNVSHVPISGYWIDIGSPNDLKHAQQLTENLT